MAQPIILGIDEVGRGPWAGPLVVGAVILGEKLNPENLPEQPQELQDFWQALTDSKKLTDKKRQKLNAIILREAAATGLGWVPAAVLDRRGLSASLKLATRRAVKQVLTHKIPFSEIIIDGTNNFLVDTPLADRVTVLKKADLLVKEVSAASIIAKVARDAYMVEIAAKYPAYGFEKHVGYGTALHKQSLLEHGICPEHRQSFRPIREIMAQNPPKTPKSPPKSPQRPPKADFEAFSAEAPSTSQKGQTAEFAVARHLKTQNHTIIAHNFKTKTYEIDLVSIQNEQIFFTEVKYSQKLATEGTPLVRVTPQKRTQMQFAATCFLCDHPKYQSYQPLLAVAAVTGQDYQVENWFPLNSLS